MNQQKQHYPIFALPAEGGYDVSELARLTGMSEGYIVNIKNGVAPLTKRFRHICCLATRRTDAELFGPAKVTEESPND